MILLIIIMYFICGAVAAVLCLSNIYKECQEIDSDDLKAVLGIFALGLLGLIMTIGIIIQERIANIDPEDNFFTNIAEKVTKFFDKHAKKDTDAAE